MEPFTLCNRECVDTTTSHNHCGACGRACGSAEACIAGRCETIPAFPQSCSELAATTRGPHRLYFERDCRKPYMAYCDDLENGPTT